MGYFEQEFTVVKCIGTMEQSGQVLMCTKKDRITGQDVPVAVKILDLEQKPLGYDILRWELLGLTEVPVAEEFVLKGVEIFEESNKAFLVTELCDMDLYSLTDLVEIPMDSARILFGKILMGTTLLHEGGLVHRDIKPENVMVRAPPGVTLEMAKDPARANLIELKIGDFGFWTNWKDQSGVERMQHEACGSDIYGPPEQTLESLAHKGYDGRKADVFSLGVLMFVLCLGFPPWESCQTNADPYFAVWSAGFIKQYWRLIQVHSGTLPDEFMHLCTSMMHIDPRMRPSAKEVCNHPFMTGTGTVQWNPSNQNTIEEGLRLEIAEILQQEKLQRSKMDRGD